MTAWCTASSSASAPRPRSTSGPSASAASARPGRSLFADPEGLALELIVDESGDPPLVARDPEIPEEHAIRGFAGVRAYASRPERSTPLLEALGFTPGWEVRGERRGGFYVYDAPPEASGLHGAGTVHHVAWASLIADHEAWRRARRRGGRSRPRRSSTASTSSRSTSASRTAILFEIATIGPGFTSDEPLETLGESLSLPPDFEHLRERLAGVLTPLPVPRAVLARTAGASTTSFSRHKPHSRSASAEPIQRGEGADADCPNQLAEPPASGSADQIRRRGPRRRGPARRRSRPHALGRDPWTIARRRQAGGPDHRRHDRPAEAVGCRPPARALQGADCAARPGAQRGPAWQGAHRGAHQGVEPRRPGRLRRRPLDHRPHVRGARRRPRGRARRAHVRRRSRTSTTRRTPTTAGSGSCSRSIRRSASAPTPASRPPARSSSTCRTSRSRPTSRPTRRASICSWPAASRCCTSRCSGSSRARRQSCAARRPRTSTSRSTTRSRACRTGASSTTARPGRSCRRSAPGGSVGLLLLDLDRFKEVNDTLGHPNGDLLLQEIGGRLHATLRESDTVARLGGDEFGLLLPTVADEVDALRVAEKIRTELRRPFELQGVRLDLEGSIGIALYPQHGEDVDTLMQRADVAMYLAQGGARRVPALRRRSRRVQPGQARARRRASPRHRPGRAVPALPAQGEAGRRPDRRRRGARPLAAPHARPAAAQRVRAARPSARV